MEREAIFEAVDRDALELHGVTALTIGVDGHERGYGVAPEATFRVASITKPIVAATALRLVEERRLCCGRSTSRCRSRRRRPWAATSWRRFRGHSGSHSGRRSA